ncbi:cell wall-binding repeat-containing protein [Clostridium sp.]|uniref:cell wall-binding repeat-containing protein n=1 Tax=Clostridium sp. TaxID=1506 RepID=UPI003D6D5DBD
MSTKTTKLLASSLSVALLATMVTIPAAAATASKQLSGLNRYETSLAIVQDGWEKNSSANVVIASGETKNMADALSAAPLAYKMGEAPILLTKSDAIPAGVLEELVRLGVKKVTIVGGTGAVSAAVEAKIKATGVTVERVSGVNRFETSLAIAKAAFKIAPTHVVLANGLASADALSVSAIAAKKEMPILLVNNKTGLTQEQKDYIAGKTVYAIGGTSVISDAVAGTATRLSGANRYETNAAILAKFAPDYSKIFLAKGTDANLVDSLVGSAYAAKGNNPVVLVDVKNGINAKLITEVTKNIKADSKIVRLGGMVTEATANAVEAMKLGVVSVNAVSAIGTKTVKVTFNKAVDTTKAVLNIKKGAAIYGSTVAWNEGKTEATLTAVVNLPAADYSVEVTGLTDKALTKAFTVSAEVASKVEVVQKSVALENSAKVVFKVSNQYGEDMKINGRTSGVVVSAYNTTQKRVEELTNLTADNKLTFKANFATTAPAKLGDVIRVTVAYAGLTAQSNITVVDPAASATIAFGTIAPLKDKVRISINETGLVVPYTMFDQFGVAAKLAAHPADGVDDNLTTISGVQFISSKPTVVDVDTFAVDADGKLTFATGADGTAIITAIINATGQVASFTVNVNSVGKVDSLVISAPTALVAAGETVKLGLSAVDQFGTIIAAKDIAGVTVTSSNNSTVTGAIVAGKLNATAVAAGTAVLTAKVGDKVVGTVTVVVEAAAIASQVKSVSFAPKFEVGAVKSLTTDDFIVVDQYGRTIDAADITFAVVEKTPADTKFNLNVNEFTAAEAGSSVMNLTATYTSAAHVATVAPVKEFTVTAIPSADITSYAITSVPTIFSEAGHAKAIELVGKTSVAQTVVLKGNKVTQATSSDTSKVTVAVDPITHIATVTGVKGAEGTSVITLWNGGTKLAETTVTLSKVAPVITTVKFNDTAETALVADVNLSDNLQVKDQYGVVIAGNGFWTTSNSAKATVSNVAGPTFGHVTMVGTPAVGDTVTIGYVSANGIVATTVLTK